MVSTGGGVVRGSRQRQRGAATMEYVLIAIVAGLGVMFALYRFSSSVGGRFEQAGRIDKVTTSDDLSGLTEDTAKGGSGGTGSGAASGGTSADVPEPTPIPLRRQDGRVQVGNFEVDFSLIIWIGAFFLIIVLLIIMRVFAAAKKKPKVKVNV
jgi:hypothetical protein